MTPKQSTEVTLSRREFLGGTAGLSFAIAVAGLPGAKASSATSSIGAWVRIAPDNRITIITPAAEMGQGSMTGVPVVLAEELDADWSLVTLEMAPADAATYGYARRGGRSMRITGSRAIRSYFEPMRIAGAQVRKFLLQAAADEWRVDVGGLITQPGVVVDPNGGRRLSYGEIAGFANLPSELPDVSSSDLKRPADFRLIGKPLDRIDIPPKVDGSAMYSIDIRLPGMVYATTVHSPVQLAAPVSWNEEELRALPGIVDVVPLSQGVALVADTFEHALAARKALRVEWSGDAVARGYNSIEELDKRYAS
ncbi:MAG: molybdopterin-dependent oxidoreductase, partial [Gammaproteobacteria bacterium]|nr:molybdopterin-dependent oxidoreductase [Gammaproteobacteria bacterium]